MDLLNIKHSVGDADRAYSAFGAGRIGYTDNDGLSECRYAGVALFDVPKHLDRFFDYYIGDDLLGLIRPGDFVAVPFGNGNSRKLAVVVYVTARSSFKDLKAIKPVYRLYPKCMSLDCQMLLLCDYMRDITFCTFGDAVRSVVPSAFFSSGNFSYGITDEGRILLARLKEKRDNAVMSDTFHVCEDGTVIPAERFNFLDLKLLESLVDRSDYTFVHESVYTLLSFIEHFDGPVTLAKIMSKLDSEVFSKLSILEEKKFVSVEFSVPLERSSSLDTVSLAISNEEADVYIAEMKRASAQLAVIRELLVGGPRRLDELRSVTGISTSVVKRLEEKGIVNIKKRDSTWEKLSADTEDLSHDDDVLAGEQISAFEDISALINSGEAKAALLHGVTGSGKTRVIKAACDEVILSGRSVIILIPEISLTPQTLSYFKRCYGNRICVIHSQLSLHEKAEAWKKMKNGEADICIGTRSAVFAPFSNLGMIVMDEEQEHTYKSDITPKYNARDVARFRCAKSGSLMLLCSATPSVESYYKAVKGVYKLIEMNNRYGGVSLPETVISDVRPYIQNGELPIGRELDAEIRRSLARKKQIILFLNRRGYNNFMSCPQCGEAVKCPNCSVSMTYHADKKRGGALICHWCGHKQLPPDKCPSCGGTHMIYIGYGIQKIEEELAHRYGEAVIMRMDADTTSEKNAFEDMLDRFRSGEADILLGTQMVTKGHDFPNVELSGVIFADFSLFLDDFRANERTFSMITQLVGRSGRSKNGGKAVIQTASPSHPVIKLAAAQDYKSFYADEIALRRAMFFPPFCKIVVVNFVSENSDAANATAEEFSKRLGKMLNGVFSDVKMFSYGPYEAPVYRVNRRYRYRILCKTNFDKRTRELFHKLLSEFSGVGRENVSVGFDVDPSST